MNKQTNKKTLTDTDNITVVATGKGGGRGSSG